VDHGQRFFGRHVITEYDPFAGWKSRDEVSFSPLAVRRLGKHLFVKPFDLREIEHSRVVGKKQLEELSEKRLDERLETWIVIAYASRPVETQENKKSGRTTRIRPDSRPPLGICTTGARSAICRPHVWFFSTTVSTFPFSAGAVFGIPPRWRRHRRCCNYRNAAAATLAIFADYFARPTAADRAGSNDFTRLNASG
jgi:hypothetical protein